ncbi:hypothetical protein BGZ58_007323 [Dissophora ornata]|nr:hypothetical protein BGZ58_007323 [Dissophora ornata]
MTTTEPVKILIAGGGLAGLLMALLCQHANISYYIFERSLESKPRGAVMSLNASIFPVFEQLGMMDDLMRISRPLLRSHVMNEDLEEVAVLEIKNLRELVGYDYVVFHRPELYKLLFSRVHAGRILRGKKVLSILQNEYGVMIRTSDNQTHHGEILVGADGAYSAVRQALYRELKKQGDLPSADETGLETGFITLVGATDPLDPSKYPGLNDEESHFHQIIGRNKPYTWSTFTIPGNRICWSAQLQVDPASSKDSFFRNSEWGPESNGDMIAEISGFRTTYGATMGDLVESTPKHLISKVLLEDKLFQTWTGGRTVLIGDAAHKVLPNAGQGAVNAFLDAVVLCNCLYDLDNDFTHDNIVTALQTYRNLRFKHVKEQYLNSKLNAKIQYGQVKRKPFPHMRLPQPTI